ncbi:MAG: YkgJ family cysteine cluster protein [Deltaproteobacteria bacterium]|nr:YkgJ family cysteine cluster protein [Deltaproteobacteria bacterium]
MNRKRPTTRTALAPRGGRSRHGASPSGFTLAQGYLTSAEHAELSRRPRFLTVIQASPDPCLSCTGYCCRARVVINTCDLVRIAAPLGMHPSSFCDLAEAESRNGEPVLIGDTPKHLLLRKAEDDHCVFLMNVDGHRRCGVHPLRPGICRIYPFSYERGQTRYELGWIMCPEKWVLSDDRRDGVLDDVESYEHDRVLDRRVVRAFNARPAEERTAQAFWEHALPAAGKALGMDVSVFTRQRPRARLKPALW